MAGKRVAEERQEVFLVSVQACAVLENGKKTGRIQANKNWYGVAISHGCDVQLIRWIDRRVPQLRHWNYSASLKYI